MDNQNLYDIYDFYHPPLWQQPWFWVVTLLGALLLGFGLFMWWQRRKRIVKKPWEIALDKLHTLTPSTYTHRDEYKRFYFTLTSILKQYLDNRYNWQTQAQTDDELVEWLERTNAPLPVAEPMRMLVEHAQLIKFANMDAIKSQAIADKEVSISLINRTKPIP